jgi:beta-xylosidase
MKTTFTSTLILFFLNLLGQNNDSYISSVWVSDNNDGTYTNPILHADYSDPDVIRLGGDYFMTASSFNSAPALPILHSKDMVNWKLINHALPKQVPKEVYAIPQHGNGVWAPSFASHNNDVYIYWGDPDYGIYMVKTSDPYGKWEEPVLVMEGKGLIDPSVLWDDDGNVYLIHAYAASRTGVNSLLTVYKMNTEATEVLGAGRHVFDGHDTQPIVEGTKFYKRNGYYYVFAPAGGVTEGWQLVLRSKNIDGPYEEKVVLEQGSTDINGPHQGAWVQTPLGEDWFYHFQDIGVYGRIVHLQPMSWENDWPVMGKDRDENGIGEPVSTHKKPNVGKKYPIISPAETDEFTGDGLGLQWQWNANPEIVWHAKLPGNDYLRLFAIKPKEGTKNLWMVPNILLQKFPAPEFTVTTKIKLFLKKATTGKRAGLIIMGMDYATLSITKDKDGFIIRQTQALNAIDGEDEISITEERINSNEVLFRVEVHGPQAMCHFSFSENGKIFTNIGKPFKAELGKWIGAKIGLFCVSSSEGKRGGYADVEYFRVSK